MSICCAVDFSPPSKRALALALACHLARRFEAELALAYVLEPPSLQ